MALLRVLAMVHAGPVDSYVWGTPVRLHPWNNVSERKALMRPDRMDTMEHAFVGRIMARGPAVFLDIGANAGLYSLHAALSSAPGGAIYVFEPNHDLLDRFLLNIDFARGHHRVSPEISVTPLAVALSDYDGEGVLVGSGGEGARRLDPTGVGQIVAVRRLDSLLADCGVVSIDVMKIDVEGGEDRILPPFLAAAPQSMWPGAIIIEHLSRRSWSIDCIDDCRARGYAVVAVTRNNALLERSVP